MINKEKCKLVWDNMWVKQDFFADNESFKQVSMGMSGGYEIALDKGSTLVRVRSLLFGARVY